MLRLLAPTLYVLTELHDIHQLPRLQVPIHKLQQTYQNFEFEIFAKKDRGIGQLRLRSLQVHPVRCNEAWWHQVWQDAESKDAVPSPAIKGRFSMCWMSSHSLNLWFQDGATLRTSIFLQRWARRKAWGCMFGHHHQMHGFPYLGYFHLLMGREISTTQFV